MKDLAYKYRDCFVDPENKKLGRTDILTCKIDTYPDAAPVHKYPYRMAPTQRDIMNEVVQEQLRLDIIEPTNEGAWASPALLVKKASGGHRLVVDFRALNAATIPKILRIPRLDDVLDSVGETNPQYFSVFDCTQGFHQIPLDEESRDLTGFICSGGKVQVQNYATRVENGSSYFPSSHGYFA